MKNEKLMIIKGYSINTKFNLHTFLKCSLKKHL